jgi:hypothetical protein
MNDNWTSIPEVNCDDYYESRTPRSVRRTRPNGETYTIETSYRRNGRAFRVAIFEDGTTMDLD